MNTTKYSFSWAVEIISLGLKYEFGSAIVNEPSVFEALTFYCNRIKECASVQNLHSLTKLFADNVHYSD